MTHIVAGYPTLAESEKIAHAMIEGGVNFLEIQIPFSDPVADGPTILQANQKALENGVTPDDCFALMQKLTAKTDTPILFMTYYNIVFAHGVERFCKRAKAAGCWGLIVPDMPIDEERHEHYLKTCKKHGLHAIQVISPITPERRLKRLGKVASGFVYCVSHFGTTGSKTIFDAKLESYLKKVKKHIKVPIALGFGISTPTEVKRSQKKADIAVVGSHLIRCYEKEGLKGVSDFLKSVSLNLTPKA